MQDSHIVLLGDCIATGQSMLWPEITGDKDFVSDAIDCAKDKVLEKKLVSWYLKNYKEKINLGSVIDHSLKAKLNKEKSMSWVTGIPGCLNLAVAGETFQGMHKKIKKNNRGRHHTFHGAYHLLLPNAQVCGNQSK